jgi:hypothetical protein
MIALDLGHFDAVRVVDQCLGDRCNQFLESHSSATPVFGRARTPEKGAGQGKKAEGKAPQTTNARSGLSGRRRILLQKLAEGGRRLSALLGPILEARTIEIQHTFSGGMKSTNVLEMAAVTRVAMISNDDAEKRSLFGAMAGKANVNGHTILSCCVKARTNGTLAPGGLVASGEQKRWCLPDRRALEENGSREAKRAGT